MTVTARERLTPADWLAMVERQIADGCWSYASLVDLRDLDHPPSERDVSVIVEKLGLLVRENGPRGPVAVVVDTLAVYGMARMFGMRADAEEVPSYTYAVFVDPDEAERWLTSRAVKTPTPMP